MTARDSLPEGDGGRRPDRRGEGGFVLLIALLAAVIPLVLILGASTTTMQSRMARMESEIRDEEALIAAESGIDEAIYQASTAAGLTSGVAITRDLGHGMTFTVTPTFLMADGEDNDGDSLVDEPDENLFQVMVEGNHGGRSRRLVAYLGPQPTSAALPSALSMMKKFSGSELHVTGSCRIDGNDYLIDGTPSGNPAVPGVTVEPPGTLAQVTANIPSGDRPKVVGAGATTPSVGTVSTTTDIAAKQLEVQNSANLVLTSGSYSNYNFGNAATGSVNVIYKSGSVAFKGNSRGAGVLFITGSLHVEGNFRFDGIIYVLGDVEIHGTTSIYGGIVTGPSCPHFYLEDTSRVFYSSQAIGLVSGSMSGKYVAFNGWQELSRH